MNLTKKNMLIISGLALSLAAVPSLAQVAPMPTKPAKQEPNYTPAPKQQPKKADPAQSQPQPKPDGMQTYGGDAQTLPDIPYLKLAVRNKEGRIQRLHQLPDIAALRSNPTVGPKTIEYMMPFVYERRNKFEQKIINNLDLYWGLTGTLIEGLDMSNMKDLGQVAEMLKPLVDKTTFTQEMVNHGILSRVQGGLNRKIVNEYKKEITDEIQVLSDDGGLNDVMRFVMNDSILESKITYNEMIAEAMGNISELIEKAGLTSKEAQALVAYQQEIDLTKVVENIKAIHVFDAEFRKLPFMDGIAILEAMREMRENPELSPAIHTINVLHAGKTAPKDGMTFGYKTQDELIAEREAKQKKKQELKQDD
tara:strand:- start:57050 stop:58144 length:1095 start_codon:yes stop_codon:yes gene_type:complete